MWCRFSDQNPEKRQGVWAGLVAGFFEVFEKMNSVLPVVTALTRGQKRAILTIVDVLLVIPALYLSLVLQANSVLPGKMLAEVLWLLPPLAVAAAAVSVLSGAAHVRLGSFEGAAVGKSATLSIGIGFASAVLAGVLQLNLALGFHFIFALSFFLLNVTSRLAMIAVLVRIYNAAPSGRRIAIYGAGKTGSQLAVALRQDRDVTVVGFFDDDMSLLGMSHTGLPVWRGQDTTRICAAFRVDEVLLAVPSTSYTRRNAIAQRIEKEGVEVKSLPTFMQLIDSRGVADKLVSFPTSAWLGREQHMRALAAEAAEYSSRTILVSGGGGYIGAELCRQVLAYRPDRLIVLDNCEFSLFRIERELLAMAEVVGAEIVPVLGSITDQGFVASVFERFSVDVVLHAAAYKHVTLVEQNPLAGIHNNVFGTKVLIKAAVDAGVRRFVQVSTDKAVRPASVMGATKRFAELLILDQAARSSETVFSIVRFGNVLGSSGSVVPIFREQIASGGPVMLTDENVTRYFMTVQEAAQLVLRAGGFARGGEVFVLDMGEPVLVSDLARQMIESAGCTVRDQANPEGDIEIHVTGLRPGEKMHEELVISEGDIITRDEKIFRVREDALSEIEIAAAMKVLRQHVDAGEADAAVSALMQVVSDQNKPATAQSETG